MNPNKAFKLQKRVESGGLPSKGNHVMIRCTECSWTRTVTRKLWTHPESQIKCTNCGWFKDWNVVGTIGGGQFYGKEKEESDH